VKVRVFTLRLEHGAFDDREVRELLADREALGVSDHLFLHDGEPRLALVVTYREPPAPMEPRAPAETVVEVAPEHKELYEALRKWRNERARRDGRPAYVLFQNGQLAEIARVRPTTLEALGKLRGVGEAKVRDFGAELLALVAQVPGATPPSGSE
jgi:superfamily II DNA helicase RecQ